jgi:hypothetical protein
LAGPFGEVGHVHLSLNVYEDVHEIMMSMGMNIIVVIGIIVDYRDKRDDSDKEEDNDNDIPIGWV